MGVRPPERFGFRRAGAGGGRCRRAGATRAGGAADAGPRTRTCEAVCRLPAAATPYQHGDQLSRVLARVDVALANAVAEGGEHGAGGAGVEQERAETGEAHGSRDLAPALRLGAGHGAGEAAQLPGGGCRAASCCTANAWRGCDWRRTRDWLHAGEFVPWLARLGDLARLDEMVVDLAIERLRNGAENLCINLSAQAMNDAVLMHRIAAPSRRDARAVAKRLWLEVPEHGVFQNLEHFRILCALLKPVGCRIGIEHVGHQVRAYRRAARPRPRLHEDRLHPSCMASTRTRPTRCSCAGSR